MLVLYVCNGEVDYVHPAERYEVLESGGNASEMGPFCEVVASHLMFNRPRYVLRYFQRDKTAVLQKCRSVLFDKAQVLCGRKRKWQLSCGRDEQLSRGAAICYLSVPGACLHRIEV